MFDDWDLRDSDARDGDDGIRDREEEWLVLGRGPDPRRSATTSQNHPEKDAKLLERLLKEVGVDDGVRTRDFRSHSPALYR